MTTTTRLSLVFLLAAAPGCATAPAAPDLARARFVELTHPFSRETLFWPTEEEGFVLEPVFKGTTEVGTGHRVVAVARARVAHVDAHRGSDEA